MRQGQPIPDYYGVQKQLESDIQATNSEIRLLNSRIAKTDYETTHLRRLEQKHHALLEKQQELTEAIRAQDYTQTQLANQRAEEQNMRHSLGTQYVHLAEDRKRRAEQERRWVIQQQRQVQEQTRRALEEEHVRRRLAMEEQKKAAMEELAMREEARRREKEQRERQKEEYNRRVQLRSQLQTQKDSVYKQYYSQFMENQDTLQGIYRNKAAVSQRERQQRREQFEQKQMQQFQERVARDQQERVRRLTEEKDMLRSFLEGQIQEKNRKKSREREQQLSYQNQVARYQVNVQQAELFERSKKKEQQKRYDEDLKMQSRSKAWSSQEGIGSPARVPHNPITNPIDFKIGITNPYLIRQYEKEKERQLGQQQLRLRNLAVLGNATLHHH